MHSAELLMTLAGGLGAALLFGYTAHYLRLSPIVGYLLAGIVVSPNTPGFVADGEIASQLAELGVMLLMFGVGLHFDIGELSRVRQYALPGAICQCGISFLVGFLIAWYGGWSVGASCVFGIASSFASTVVVTRVFSDRNELQTHAGNVALGWLIVQDVLAVLALVLLPPLTQEGSTGVGSILWLTMFTILKLAVVGIAIVWIGGRIVPAVLRRIADTRSRELFTLSVLVLVLGIALGASELFGVSVALGAFLAGVVVGQSDFSL
ncbi:MAG: cation:proton antiporter, partial [Planctomycetes bacterium]|nr:cation:proton antiporter [Planctomycetota bacterium]